VATVPEIIAAAKEASRYFETRKRQDGEEFVTLKDDRPEWVHELARKAHGDMLPDDHRYEMIRYAVNAIAEAPEDSQGLDEIPYSDDGPVSVYTGDQLKWLASRADRYSYVDQRIEDLGEHADSIMEDIRGGWASEWDETFQLVLQALTEHASQ
jgi:hypothetical protein